MVALSLGNRAAAQSLTGKVTGSGTPLPGVSVHWAGTTTGTISDTAGRFVLSREAGHGRLVASFLGYANDTVEVETGTTSVEFDLRPSDVVIDEITVQGRMQGNYIRAEGVLKNETISFAGLTKMACCNLAESFENSAAVTVGYGDAISGARQIKMLGLAGTYTQILDESRPIMSGLDAPYGLNYIPGMWLKSIQISKGVASVTAGHEAIAGQINLEHRKPTDDERLFANLYLDDELRTEANVTTALPVTADGKLSTVLLLHGSLSPDVRKTDHNRDGFRDQPETDLIDVANKWLYTADNGMQLRWGWKLLQEDRLGGMSGYRKSMRDEMLDRGIYGSYIRNRGIDAYVKLGMPVGAPVLNSADSSELQSNIAAIIDFDHFDTDGYFGLNDYDGHEKRLSAKAMYNRYFSERSSLMAGMSALMRFYREHLLNPTPWLGTTGAYRLDRDEHEAGVFAEYTYSIKDKFTLVTGLRGDYNTYFEKFYLTPRGHLRWDMTSSTVLRASAGLGYRSANLIADRIGVLATGRELRFPDGLSSDFDRMEKALTFGGSLTQTFGLVGKEDASLSFDFFRTRFYNQMIADQEFAPDYVMFYTSEGLSYTNSYQIDFTWKPALRFDIFATFRYTESAVTLDRPDGSVERVERPLTDRYKALLNVQYASQFRRWVFDFTAQLNGPSRLPALDGNPAVSRYSPRYPIFFVQATRKLGRFDLYVGCENIGNYRQHDPITVDGHAFRPGDDPFVASFNSSVVWGPLMGRKFYAGFRFNLY